MNNQSFFNKLLLELEHLPNQQQSDLITALEKFLKTQEVYPVFLLQGYAGTGKTTIMSALVRTLQHFKIQSVLLAPTGRAAKVFSLKSNKNATTIHKQIYRAKSKTDLYSPMSLQPNLFKNTIFIVDEASMIGDYTMDKNGSFSGKNLLEDLIEYVFSGKNCKLILLGDIGQLPPVGSDFSPALNLEYMENYYPRLHCHFFQLNDVVRQKKSSGILWNATTLRKKSDTSYPQIQTDNFPDVIRLNGADLQDEIESSYSRVGMENSIFITRSNKRANEFNRHIRGRVLWHEEDLSVNDILMVVKNNYYWLSDEKSAGFIANGERILVKRIVQRIEIYGFEFVKANVIFLDTNFEDEKEVILHLESLHSESASIPRERLKELFFEIEKDFFHIKNKKKRYEAILGNPFFNALQVKFAYAVTCHKSQGGQWADVFIDHGYITEDMMGKEFDRWLYTAITRAYEHVFLVNFHPEFFSEN